MLSHDKSTARRKCTGPLATTVQKHILRNQRVTEGWVKVLDQRLLSVRRLHRLSRSNGSHIKKPRLYLTTVSTTHACYDKQYHSYADCGLSAHLEAATIPIDAIVADHIQRKAAILPRTVQRWHWCVCPGSSSISIEYKTSFRTDSTLDNQKSTKAVRIHIESLTASHGSEPRCLHALQLQPQHGCRVVRRLLWSWTVRTKEQIHSAMVLGRGSKRESPNRLKACREAECL